MAREANPLGHRLGLVSLIVGMVAPRPFQLAPLSSSRAKQPGWRSSVAAGRNVSFSGFFVGFRVRMQPQTRNAATIAQKIPRYSCCIVVSSVALTPLQAIIKRSAYQVLRTNSGSFVTLAAILRPSGRREMVDRDLTNRKAALLCLWGRSGLFVDALGIWIRPAGGWRAC